MLIGMPLFAGRSLAAGLAERDGAVRPLQLDWRGAQLTTSTLTATMIEGYAPMPPMRRLVCHIPWSGDGWLWHRQSDVRPLYVPSGQLDDGMLILGCILPVEVGEEPLRRTLLDQKVRLLECLALQVRQIAQAAGPRLPAAPRPALLAL